MLDFSDNITCPYCGYEDEEHSEYPRDLDRDGNSAEVECSSCMRAFFATVSVSYAYGSSTLEDTAEHEAIQQQVAAAHCYRHARDGLRASSVWQDMARVQAATARAWQARLVREFPEVRA